MNLQEILNAQTLPEWLHSASEEEIISIINQLNLYCSGEQKGRLLEKLSPIARGDCRNVLWEANHRTIMREISDYVKIFQVPPSKAELARRTGLSRVTVDKHIKQCPQNPLYRNYIQDYSLLCSEVMGKVFTLAINKDNIPAAKLFLQMAPKLPSQLLPVKVADEAMAEAKNTEEEMTAVAEIKTEMTMSCQSPAEPATAGESGTMQNTSSPGTVETETVQPDESPQEMVIYNSSIKPENPSIPSDYIPMEESPYCDLAKSLLAKGPKVLAKDMENLSIEEVDGVNIVWYKAMLSMTPEEQEFMKKRVWDVMEDGMKFEVEALMRSTRRNLGQVVPRPSKIFSELLPPESSDIATYDKEKRVITINVPPKPQTKLPRAQRRAIEREQKKKLKKQLKKIATHS